MRYCSIIFMVSLTAAAHTVCASQDAYQSYTEAERAFAAANLPAAKTGYAKALELARASGDYPGGSEAYLLRKYGRVLGNLCERQAAEKAMIDALRAIEKEFPGDIRRIPPFQIELAQFTFDTGQYAKAITYYEAAFDSAGPVLREKAPEDFALLMRDYAIALKAVGREDDARVANMRATSLSEKGKGNYPEGAGYIPYPKTCK